ncbi:MAG: LPS export ABC transporter ATP-binding protein [Bacteroidales bacterium]|nr:LPS export ABC transporter ATP-binding protein [Bacteroidales bacterium]
MALLDVTGLVKWYGKRQVVKGVSFDVNAGEIVGLLGPNGAGKTTSFRMTTGQITPNDGRVLFAGVDVTHLPMFRRARLGMGYLSQEQSIFRKLTVEQNLLAILEALPQSRTLGRKLTRAERWERAEEALARFNLTHVRKNTAARCSGGEKRRLEIARCLVCEPLLILLDEPFAAVDPKTTEDIRANIRELAETGIGILLTDHNVREVVKTADRIFLIVDGKVVCRGTPDQIIRDKIAIDAYLGSTFEDDALMARLAGFASASSSPATVPIPAISEEPIIPLLAENVAPPVPPSAPAPVPASLAAAPEQTPEPVPAPLPTPPRPATLPMAAPTPGFSSTAQALLEQEKIRRWVAQLGDAATMPQAWHELVARGPATVPVLLEALERPDLEVRHLAFRLLESITGEALVYQSDAPPDIRLRQVAYLRAKLERRAG